MKAKRHFTLSVATVLIAAGIILHTDTGLALLITGMLVTFINTLY